MYSIIFYYKSYNDIPFKPTPNYQNDFVPIPTTYSFVFLQRYTNNHPYELIFRGKDNNNVTQDLSLLFFARANLYYFFARLNTTNNWGTYKLEKIGEGIESYEDLEVEKSEDSRNLIIRNLVPYDHICFLGINHSSAILYKIYRTDVQ